MCVYKEIYLIQQAFHKNTTWHGFSQKPVKSLLQRLENVVMEKTNLRWAFIVSRIYTTLQNIWQIILNRSTREANHHQSRRGLKTNVMVELVSETPPSTVWQITCQPSLQYCKKSISLCAQAGFVWTSFILWLFWCRGGEERH